MSALVDTLSDPSKRREFLRDAALIDPLVHRCLYAHSMSYSDSMELLACILIEARKVDQELIQKLYREFPAPAVVVKLDSEGPTS